MMHTKIIEPIIMTTSSKKTPIFFHTMTILLCLISPLIHANACYRHCKIDQECTNTCGTQWFCNQEEGLCLPIAIKKQIKR